ncbi:MAG: hypothetical protein U0326_26055 [Polyangiales bacterium]
MPDHDPKAPQTNARERYEAPRVVEDLPLESFSLACTPGKAAGQCELDGLPIAT